MRRHKTIVRPVAPSTNRADNTPAAPPDRDQPKLRIVKADDDRDER